MSDLTDIQDSQNSLGKRDAQHGQDLQGVEELLARARQGNREAENRLFDHLDARILALAKRRVRDEEAARDIAQETMQTVYEKYRTADLPRGLLPWVFVVLRNKVGNYLKRSRVEGSRRIVVEDTWMAEAVGVSPDGDRAAFDLVRQLEIALAQATAECREIFRLLLGGAGRHEIRAAFGDEPLGTVDSRISRCRRKLIEEIERAARGAGRSPDGIRAEALRDPRAADRPGLADRPGRPGRSKEDSHG
jgi:RNA polymerase sigma factor (sigma-70 family)